uniref:C2 domain-containing protein n=1 Tax=Haplochromis burtoni TaxID=8153 RepID=A0A3Q3CM15_HAPBU
KLDSGRHTVFLYIPLRCKQTSARSGMYKLEIELKRGHNLAVRDRGGTSDPYVKFKLAGKEVFRSKIIHKNLNPVWDEKTTLIIDSLNEPLYVKVFDYDFGLQDDFMGSAFLYLESLEQQRTIPVTLVLKDPQYPDQDLGTLELAVNLTPKDSPIEERRDSTVCMQIMSADISLT